MVSRHRNTLLSKIYKEDGQTLLWWDSSDILKKIKYYIWFKDCLSSINGTHILVVIPTKKVVPYKFGWKNVQAERYDSLFFKQTIHVDKAWMEGHLNDFLIFMEAI